jgi:hypothetical protein
MLLVFLMFLTSGYKSELYFPQLTETEPRWHKVSHQGVYRGGFTNGILFLQGTCIVLSATPTSFLFSTSF